MRDRVKRVIADARIQRAVRFVSEHTDIVQAALEATRQLGADPVLDIGSTDANIPMSMGIPAIDLGGGGRSGNTHTPEEWFDPTNRALGLQRLLVLMGVLAGLE